MRAQIAPVRLLSKVPVSADVVVVGVRSRNGKDEIFALDEMSFVENLLRRADVTSAPDSVTRIPDPTNDKRTLILTGLGPGDVSVDALRYSVGAAMRKSGEFKSLAVAIPTSSRGESGQSSKAHCSEVILSTNIAPQKRPKRMPAVQSPS